MSARTSFRVFARRHAMRRTRPLQFVRKEPEAPTPKSRYALPVALVRPRRQDSKGNRKLDEMEAARQLGWKGNSYRKAKRFARKLDAAKRGAT